MAASGSGGQARRRGNRAEVVNEAGVPVFVAVVLSLLAAFSLRQT
jgi:hypothetical protein